MENVRLLETYYSGHDILSRIDSLRNVGVFRICFGGCNIPSERSSLAREGIFLALSKADRHSIYRYISERGLPVAVKYGPLQSPRINTEEMLGTVIKTKVLVER